MRYDLRNRCAVTFLAAALLAVPVAAKDKPAQSISDRLPKICAELQKKGWGVPPDQLKMDPGTKAEMRLGKVYMCTLEHQLAGKGPGRAPDLGVLLASTSNGPGLIFSVNVWCAADRAPAIEALAKEVERILTDSGIPVPAELLEAVRASRSHDGTSGELRYQVEPIEVDAGACARVPPGELGAVLMKMDVAVKAGA